MIKAFRNKLLLGVLCIAIGMVPLLGLVNTVESGKAAFSDNFNKDGLKLVSVQLNGAQADYGDIRILEREMPGVKALVPIVDGTAEISSYKAKNMIKLKAVGSDYWKYSALDILKGSFINKSHVEKNQRTVVLDDLTADKLFGTTDIVGRTVKLSYNGSEFEAAVVGICRRMDLSEDKIDSEQGIAFIPISVMDNYVEQYSINELLVLMDIHIEEAKARIPHYLKEIGVNGEAETSVVNQFGIIKSFLEDNTLMFIAAAVLWFFAMLVGLINIMMVDVAQDKRYFGLLKFYGNTEKKVRRVIYSKALNIGAAASVFSIALGTIASFIICRYLNIPLHISVHTLTLGVLLPGILCLTAAVYPAVKAAKTDMNKAIWQFD